MVIIPFLSLAERIPFAIPLDMSAGRWPPATASGGASLPKSGGNHHPTTGRCRLILPLIVVIVVPDLLAGRMPATPKQLGPSSAGAAR